MDLRGARVFVAAAEELSFTRAAERLMVSPPTVSETVKALERHFRHRLFTRDPRSVQLTEFGRELLPAARALLDAHDDLEARALELRGASRIAVGLLYGIGATLMRQVTQKLTAQDAAGAAVKIYDWAEPTCGLRTGEVDVAVLVGPTSFDEHLSRVRLGHMQRLALVPQDATGDARDEITLAEVDAIGWVPVLANDKTWDRAWRLDDVRGGAPPLNGSVQTTIEGLIDAIRAGIGATVTIEAFSKLYAPDRVRLLPVTDVPPLPVDLAFRDDPTSPRNAKIIKLTQQLYVPGEWY